MPAHAPATGFPVRGTPGGWKDWFDDDNHAALRAQAEASARRLEQRTAALAAAWQAEPAEERRARGRERDRGR